MPAHSSGAPTVAQLLRSADEALRTHSESAALDSQLLLAHALGVPRTQLLSRSHEPLASAPTAMFARLIAQRAGGVPVAYLTSRREFWSLTLRITPEVLVPRPETETLVEQALLKGPPSQPCQVLDLGTGSGAIALALGKERPLWRITGVDVSPEALSVARSNAESLQLRNVRWCRGSWFDGVCDRFDIIVSNPPYIAADDPALAALTAEPMVALTPGPTGLEALTAIIEGAPAHLQEGGWLLLEHGCAQASEVSALLTRRGFAAVRSIADLAGRPRITFGTYYSPAPKEIV